MRSFMGTRSGGGDKKNGKPTAAQMYKDRLAAKNGEKAAMTQEEIYKKIIEDRMAKMMEDYLLGKKKNANSLPGTKTDDKPKEVSKSTLTVIRMLAVRREQKDRKIQMKKDLAFKRAKQAKLNEEKRVKLLAEQEELTKQAQFKAEYEAKNSSSSWWGGSDDGNKGGWW